MLHHGLLLLPVGAAAMPEVVASASVTPFLEANFAVSLAVPDVAVGLSFVVADAPNISSAVPVISKTS